MFGRQTEYSAKKPGGEKRDPEAAAVFGMPYLANRVQPGEASKNRLRARAIPPSAQIMSPYAGKRNLTHFDIIQEKLS